MPRLQLHTRREYGNVRRYLPNDAIGQAVRALTGKATLSPQELQALQTLGVDVDGMA